MIRLVDVTLDAVLHSPPETGDRRRVTVSLVLDVTL
jgi:hypothetical protein